MSLFDRLLEQQLRPAPTPARPAAPAPSSAPRGASSNAAFEAKREKWREAALAQASAPRREPRAGRADLEPEVIERMLAPPPAPPPPKAVGVTEPLVSRGSCKAINPDTGRQCALLNGHTKPHRHGSTEFVIAAAPGQRHFARRDRLEQFASSRSYPTTGET